MRQITVGILGAGRIGQVHGNNLLRMPGIKLKAVTDPFVDFSSWPPAPVVTAEDPDLILEDDEIEAVLVCSPTPTHADLTERSARAGKHVFCEKPIDLDPNRIRRTLGIVEENGVKLQVGFNRRFDPTFARVRQAGRSRHTHVLDALRQDHVRAAHLPEGSGPIGFTGVGGGA